LVTTDISFPVSVLTYRPIFRCPFVLLSVTSIYISFYWKGGAKNQYPTKLRARESVLCVTSCID